MFKIFVLSTEVRTMECTAYPPVCVHLLETAMVGNPPWPAPVVLGIYEVTMYNHTVAIENHKVE